MSNDRPPQPPEPQQIYPQNQNFQQEFAQNAHISGYQPVPIQNYPNYEHFNPMMQAPPSVFPPYGPPPTVSFS